MAAYQDKHMHLCVISCPTEEHTMWPDKIALWCTLNMTLSRLWNGIVISVSTKNPVNTLSLFGLLESHNHVIPESLPMRCQQTDRSIDRHGVTSQAPNFVQAYRAYLCTFRAFTNKVLFTSNRVRVCSRHCCVSGPSIHICFLFDDSVASRPPWLALI